MSKSKVYGFDEWVNWIDDIPVEVIKNVESITKKSALKIESDSKWNVAIDTGRLEGSINADDVVSLNGVITAEIGTNVEYAEDVEFGNSRQLAQPYLIPAFNKETTKYKKAVKDALTKAVD